VGLVVGFTGKGKSSNVEKIRAMQVTTYPLMV
jgi:hypothetical protein